MLHFFRIPKLLVDRVLRLHLGLHDIRDIVRETSHLAVLIPHLYGTLRRVVTLVVIYREVVQQLVVILLTGELIEQRQVAVLPAPRLVVLSGLLGVVGLLEVAVQIEFAVSGLRFLCFQSITVLLDPRQELCGGLKGLTTHTDTLAVRLQDLKGQGILRARVVCSTIEVRAVADFHGQAGAVIGDDIAKTRVV